MGQCFEKNIMNNLKASTGLHYQDKDLSFEEKYNAIGKKESLYEGAFITAVTTTGIFCRPSCRAKNQKQKM